MGNAATAAPLLRLANVISAFSLVRNLLRHHAQAIRASCIIVIALSNYMYVYARQFSNGVGHYVDVIIDEHCSQTGSNRFVTVCLISRGVPDNELRVKFFAAIGRTLRHISSHDKIIDEQFVVGHVRHFIIVIRSYMSDLN